LEIDRSLTKEAHKSAFTMVDEKTSGYELVPSNHCVDSEGTLWAVTQENSEPVSSIKAYVKGEKKGEVVTHFYPQNHPGGWPESRSMAISKTGILAYTDTEKNRIDLYQIK